MNINNGKMTIQDTPEGWISYAEYVRENRIPYKLYTNIYNTIYMFSETWRNRRVRAKKRDEFRCQICGDENQRLYVHHLTYDRIFWERLEDLQTLCEDCHKKKHGRH